LTETVAGVSSPRCAPPLRPGVRRVPEAVRCSPLPGGLPATRTLWPKPSGHAPRMTTASVVRVEGIISSKRYGITVGNALMADGRVVRFHVIARDPVTVRANRRRCGARRCGRDRGLVCPAGAGGMNTVTLHTLIRELGDLWREAMRVRLRRSVFPALPGARALATSQLGTGRMD
jgi:hypothetical protein